MMNNTQTNPIQPGDIFVESWGYEQTNIDFYQVVSVTPSGKSVRIRKIGSRIVREARGTDYVAPDVGAFTGPLMTKRVRASEYQDWMIRINSFSYAFKHDGRERGATAAGWGH